MLCTQLFNKYTRNAIKADLANAIKLEILSWQMAKEALHCFTGKPVQLEQFDPVVGDTACQIRTDKILKIYSDKDLLQEEINALLCAIPIALANLNTLQEEHHQLMLRDNAGKIRSFFKDLEGGWDAFLSRHDIPCMALSEDMKFLVISYLISRYYSQKNSTKVKTQDSFCERFKLSSRHIDRVFHEARKLLNSVTNDHICFIGESVASIEQSERLQALINSLKQVEQVEGWKSHAAYSCFALLLKYWWIKKIPIVLTVKVLCSQQDHPLHITKFYYSAGEELDSYDYTSNSQGFVGMPGVALQGVSDRLSILKNLETDQMFHILAQVKKNDETNEGCECQEVADLRVRIKEISLKDILLVTGATHPQFVNKTKEINFVDLGPGGTLLKKEYEQLYALGSQEGLCKENPSTLRIIHIHPTIVNNFNGSNHLQ